MGMFASASSCVFTVYSLVGGREGEVETCVCMCV